MDVVEPEPVHRAPPIPDLLLTCGAALLAVVMLAIPRPADAQTAITEIVVRGNERISEATIRQIAGLGPGKPADPAEVNRALKALFASGQFADVRIEERDGRLLVSVAENPMVARVSITGSKAIEEKTVRAELKLAPRQPYTRAEAEADARRIRDLYRRRGHQDARVEIEPSELPGNRIDLTFAIEEAAVVKIERIVFEGNRAFPAATLRDVIASREKSWLDILRTTVHRDDARFDLDRDLILRHYLKRGYADVRVAEPAVSRGEDGITLTFSIDEGPLYRIGRTRIASDTKDVDTRALEHLLPSRSGDVYDAERIEASIERMMVALADGGHLRADVAVEPHHEPSAGTIDLTWRVRYAPPLTIERIEIRGNARTREEVIRRELRFAEGDGLNRVLLERAKRRIRALGLFKKVEIAAARGTAPDRVALTIEVEEAGSRDLGFGVGYSTTEGITGDVSLAERNLMGRGQTLKLTLAGSEMRREAELSFTEPYFLGRRLAAGFDLFYRDSDMTRASSYKSTRAGGDVRLGFELAESWRATTNYTFVRSRIYDVGVNASAAIKEAVSGSNAANAARYDTSSVGYSVAYDTRNRSSNPTSGIYVSTTQDLAGVGGDVRYLRTVAEARGYFPVTDRVTLATRAIGGTIVGWGGSEVRLLDLFYKGGETIRGFATGGIGPRDMLSANRDALGGHNFLATTAELRFPVPFVSDDVGLRAALFADAGSLWRAGRTAQALPGVVGTTAQLRASAGASLIWDSPVGPLRVDYAQPLVKQPYDKTQPLRFGLVPGF